MTKTFLLCTKALDLNMRSILGHASILVQNMMFEHILQVMLEQDYSALHYGFVPDGLELINDSYPLNEELSAIQIRHLSVDFYLVKQALHDAIYETIGQEIDIINYDIICSNLLMIISDE